MTDIVVQNGVAIAARDIKEGETVSMTAAIFEQVQRQSNPLEYPWTQIEHRFENGIGRFYVNGVKQ